MVSRDKGTSGSSIQEWVSWLKDGVILDDADEAVVQALVHNLADLGVLQCCGEDSWALAGIEAELSTSVWRAELLKKMETLGSTDKGFALRYFLAGEPINPATPDFLKDLECQFNPTANAKPLKKSGLTGHKKASDLSTLQIVKKMGRQLSPFLELERRMISHLMGANTSKNDAQKICHYVLGKIKKKVKPREWEQISRRRHK